MNTAILISPEAKSAYFQDYIDVAQRELGYVMGDIPCRYERIGSLDFLLLEAHPTQYQQLLRLSCTQGLFSLADGHFIPIPQEADFLLHEDFVFGSKYKGKTNERLTQLLLNVGLATLRPQTEDISLLDPMAGRGTTLFWGLRYGISSHGIELDTLACEDMHRHIKKWTKLHKQKHTFRTGFLGVIPNKRKEGVHLHLTVGENSLDAVQGDCKHVSRIYREKQFHLIISDIPYGVQHVSAQKTRNPMHILAESLPFWKNVLHKDGAIVLSFNSNLPKRDVLVELFAQHGLCDIGFSIPHRMSESILRDVAIFSLDADAH